MNGKWVDITAPKQDYPTVNRLKSLSGCRKHPKFAVLPLLPCNLPYNSPNQTMTKTIIIHFPNPKHSSRAWELPTQQPNQPKLAATDHHRHITGTKIMAKNGGSNWILNLPSQFYWLVNFTFPIRPPTPGKVHYPVPWGFVFCKKKINKRIGEAEVAYGGWFWNLGIAFLIGGKKIVWQMFWNRNFPIIFVG